MILAKAKQLTKKLATANHIRSFFKNALDNAKDPSGKRILIYAGIGQMYISYFEIMLYHLLRKEGYTVDYLIYDEHISINELITKDVISYKGKDAFWNKDVKKAKKLLKDAGVDYTCINANREDVHSEVQQHGTSLTQVFDYKKDGLALGQIVQNTMYRFYKSLSFGDDALSVAQKFLHTTLTNYSEIKERTTMHDYDYVCYSHGIYVTWEPVTLYCKQQEINFISYDRAKMKDTISINFNQVAPDWSFNTGWERYLSKTLLKEERKRVSDYLKDRELQTNDVYAYNFSKRAESIPQLKKQLNIPLNNKVITLFTNLIWDAANVARDLAFSNAFECLIATIDYYNEQEEVHIVIRAHPAEKVLGTKERYGDLLRSHYNNVLPDNVTIIDPEMDVNSFSVIDISDIGVVNTSTVGLEFALLGKPIVLISETHYRNKGFTYDVDSSEAYFKQLDDLLKEAVLLPNQVALAEKYFYMMMFLYQKEIPIHYNKGVFEKYGYKQFDDIPDDDILFQLIEKIKSGKTDDFIFWD